MAGRQIASHLDLAQSNDTSLPDSGLVRIKAKPDGFVYLVLPEGKELKIGKGGASVPTLVTLEDGFEIPSDTQALFTKKITLEDGARIVLEGLLVEVN